MQTFKSSTDLDLGLYFDWTILKLENSLIQTFPSGFNASLQPLSTLNIFHTPVKEMIMHSMMLQPLCFEMFS